MSGACPLEFSAAAGRFARGLLLGAAVLCLLADASSASAQTPAPADPAASPADPNTSALPTDPMAPPTIQTPSTSLIPTQPLSILDPPPTATSTPNGVKPLPTAIPADPLALPPTTQPAPGSSPTTTNNIGTARRFQYSFLLSLGTTFDDNLFLTTARKQSDVYFTIQPSVSLGLGGGVASTGAENTVRFSYSPQVLLYADHGELDTVQHFVALSGTYHLARITLSGSQSVQILDNTDVGNPQAFGQSTSGTGLTPVQTGTAPVSNVNLDTSQRTRLNLYSTSLDANYFVSDKVSYDASAQFSDSQYQTLLSSSSLSGSTYFNYSPTGKTTTGLGVTVGYVFAERPTPDQSFEQGNFRVSYTPSVKLFAAGQVGLEVRQSSGQNGSAVTPIFDLSASYAPFDGTSISLAGSRQVATSAVVGGQDYTLTSLSVSFSQRFFQRLFTRLSVSYSHDDYTSVVASTNATRSDDYVSVQPSLDYNVRENLTVGGFYSFRRAASTENDRNFNDNQVGIRLSLTF